MERARGIFFVDLDGTLVGPDGIAPRVWPALAELGAAGWHIGVCTGRPGRGIALDVARRVDVDGLHVFESGAVVMRGSGALASACAIDPADVAALADASLATGATLEVYTADGRYLVRDKNGFVRDHEALLGFDAEVIDWPPRALSAPVVRAQWVVARASWPSLEREVAPAMTNIAAHEGTSPRMPGVSFVSMTARGTSKGSAIATVLAAFGLGRADAAMAGDNLNDLEAFDAVDRIFVPSDGAPAALARAHHVIGTPAAGGVADAVAALLALGAAPSR